MSKLLLNFIGIVTLSLSSLSFAQNVLFQPPTPSNKAKTNTSTNSRTPLTPEQFKARVQARDQESRQEISQNAAQAIDKMNRTQPSQTFSPSTTTPTPSTNNTNRTQTPVNPSPPYQTPANNHHNASQPASDQVYTGFPTDTNNGTKPSNNNSSSSSDWNIKY